MVERRDYSSFRRGVVKWGDVEYRYRELSAREAQHVMDLEQNGGSELSVYGQALSYAVESHELPPDEWLERPAALVKAIGDKVLELTQAENSGNS